MKKAISKIVAIAMLVTMFTTAVNLCTASAAPNYPQQKVTNHHKHPPEPVKTPKPMKTLIPVKTLNPTHCVIPTPTLPCCSTPPAIGNFSISIGSISTSPNENIILPVYFDNIREEIAVCNFDITYDPKQLEYISCEPGSIVPDPTNNFEINKPKDGTLKVLFIDSKDLTKFINLDGIFANLKFKVIGTSNAETSLNISNSTVGDLNLNTLITDIQPGKVTIVETPTPPIVTPTTTSLFEITVGSKQSSPNENISLPIYFDDIPVGGIETCNIEITYDPKELEYISDEPGSIVANPTSNFAVNKQEDGILKILFLDYTLGNEGIKSCGVFANLNFKVIGTSYEVTHIKIPSSVVGDLNLNSIDASVYPGAVIIEAPQKQVNAFCCKIGSTEAKVGDTVTLPVNFENVPDKGIAACDMTIAYDPEQLEYVDYAPGSIVNNPDNNFKINKPSDGTIKILFLDETMKDEYITSNGIFTNLTFKVLDSKNKSTLVRIVNSSFADIDINTINSSYQPGTIYFISSSEPNLGIK